MLRKLITIAVPLSLTGIAPIASAETRHHPVAATHEEQNGYGYEFTDDKLLGGGNSTYGSTIRVPGRFPKTLLIRPRTQFVAEMLKSVEVL